MLTPDQAALQRQIMTTLQVATDFDVDVEITRRVDFLVEYLLTTRLQTLVLGISGGVDSLLGGLLAQRAVEQLRLRGHQARFVAMRLPYGQQSDEVDAMACLEVIRPDECLVTNIKPAVDASVQSLLASGLVFRDAAQQDFLVGNIKARQRMIMQYAVAGAKAGLVIGTDQAAEALMGFFTKFGDGAADVTPLNGLSKRRVRALAQALGAPEALACKIPTADLESLVPLRPDEDAFGVSYEQIDDFLEGKEITPAVFDIIAKHWHTSAHKRALPVCPDVLI
ncbi:MAG: ammonia-dependent NAD(+) synthetase [Burkholderiaceae bacterium]|nr:ammonia-dependent NAD(+) synthetase [Burkholderiaceae bacterium]